MIINFEKFRARRCAPNVIALAKSRLVCRWVVDPDGGKLRAVWAPGASESAIAARPDEPGRLCLAA